MAKSKAKAAKAGGVTAVTAASPYVQRLIQDEQLRGDIKSAFDSARVAYGRINNGKAPTQLLDDKKLQKELRKAAYNVKDVSVALHEAPNKKRRGLSLKRVVLLGAVGTGVALAVSEGLRKKALDTLFGAEEEFEYTSNTGGAAAPPSPTTASPN